MWFPQALWIWMELHMNDSSPRLSLTTENCFFFYISTPRGCWWGFGGNMMIFLGFLFKTFVLFDELSPFCSLPPNAASSLPPFLCLLPSFPHLPPSSLHFFLPVCFGDKKLCAEEKSMLQYEIIIPVSQESYKRWTKSKLFLRIHFFASRTLLLFPSCDTYFSFWGISNLRAPGLRSVVRTTGLSVILYCLT